MTLNARPKGTYMGHSRVPEENIRTVPCPPEKLIIECEIFHPTSARGKKVFVHIEPSQITDLLLLAKDTAAYQRKGTMKNA